MSHVTHIAQNWTFFSAPWKMMAVRKLWMNKWCHTYEWFTLLLGIGHVCTCVRVTSHIQTSYVTPKKLCHAYRLVMSRVTASPSLSDIFKLYLMSMSYSNAHVFSLEPLLWSSGRLACKLCCCSSSRQYSGFTVRRVPGSTRKRQSMLHGVDAMSGW